MIRKRRQYRALCEGQGGRLARLLRLSAPVRPFELEDEARDTLARWRTDAGVEAAGTRDAVDDPTSEGREPDLREWEARGDRCDPDAER